MATVRNWPELQQRLKALGIDPLQVTSIEVHVDHDHGGALVAEVTSSDAPAMDDLLVLRSARFDRRTRHVPVAELFTFF